MGFQAEPGNQVKFPLRPPGGEGKGEGGVFCLAGGRNARIAANTLEPAWRLSLLSVNWGGVQMIGAYGLP